MGPETLFDEIRAYLPPWLNSGKGKELFEQLKGFPSAEGFYSTRNDLPDLMQGDAWSGLIITAASTSERKSTTGIVLSNTCDIAAQNKRDLAPGIVFAPLIRLSGYLDRLKASGKHSNEISDKARAIRAQKISNIVFLPEIPSMFPESIALLDDLYTNDLLSFVASPRERRFALSNYGFYVFLIKISVHFTRVMDGVDRS